MDVTITHTPVNGWDGYQIIEKTVRSIGKTVKQHAGMCFGFTMPCLMSSQLAGALFFIVA